MNNNVFYIHMHGYDFKVEPSVLESYTVNFHFVEEDWLTGSICYLGRGY